MTAFRSGLALLLTLAFCAPAWSAGEDRYDGNSIRQDAIVVIPIQGEITKATHIFLRRNLKLAERAGAKAVILDMDTPGGDLTATDHIQSALLATKVPTFTFINTNAASAGALISLATKQIWMAPVAAIGAAAPVQGGGKDLDKTMKDKVISYYSARARSIAEAQGHNPEIAQAFMDKDKEVKIGDEVINPKGKLLTLDSKSATRRINGKPVLAEGIATSITDLVKQAKLEGPLVRLEPSGFERIGIAIAGLAPLFLLGGLVCGYLEFKMPGATIPGFLAAIFFALFFFGHYIVGLAGFETIALFVVGALLIAVEFAFFPGVILPAVLGVAMMLAALVLAMADRYPSQPFIPSMDQLTLPLFNLGLAIAFAAIVISVLVTMLPKTSFYSRFVLSAAVPGGPVGPRPGQGSAGPAVVLGMTGVTRTPLRPAGKAQFGAAQIDVVSEGEFLDPGTDVRISDIEGARVAVKRVVAS